MAIIKCISLFQLGTNPSGGSRGSRIGGWSESVLFSGVFADAVTRFNNYCEKRAAMLANSAAVVGQRYQLIDPEGRTQTAARRFQGTLGACDVPQMAVTFTVPASGSPNIRRFVLRGLPDGYAVEGEFAPTPAFDLAFGLWKTTLTYFGFQCLNLLATTVPVTSIAADGTFVLQKPIVFAPNDYLSISRARDVSGNTHNGRFHVQTMTDTQHGKFDDWVGLATLGGTARPDAYLFQGFNAPQASEPTLTLRKVGRPFTPYRGRASARA